MGRNIIEEYLVSLGFRVDQSSMQQALDAVQNGANKMTTFASKFAGNIGKVGASTLAFIATTTVSIAKFVDSVADADIEMQNQANSMWMNVDAYRNMDNAVKTLGYSMSDLSEIARNPELTQRFKELYALSKQTEAPKELDEYLRKVRDVTTEMSKVKVLFRNGVRWVAYFLGKMSGGDIDKLYESIRKKIDYLQTNLPSIAENIAKVLYIFLQMGERLFKIIGWIFDLLIKLLKWFLGLPRQIKTTALAIAGILLVAFHPVILMVGSIIAALLLIDDYMGWKEGKNSYFDWSGFDNTLNGITTWWKSVTNWTDNKFDDIKEWWEGVKKWFGLRDKDSDNQQDGQQKSTASSVLETVLKNKFHIPQFTLDTLRNKFDLAEMSLYRTGQTTSTSSYNVSSNDTYNIDVKTSSTSPYITARAIEDRLNKQKKTTSILNNARSKAVTR